MPSVRARVVSEPDAAIGARIRLRRKQLGITQSDLAQSLGVTFQQVQKYERGVNRVAANRLVQIADKLDMQVTELLGRTETCTAGTDTQVVVWLAEPGALEVLGTYSRLTSAERKAVLSVVRALDQQGRDD